MPGLLTALPGAPDEPRRLLGDGCREGQVLLDEPLDPGGLGGTWQAAAALALCVAGLTQVALLG